MRSAGTCFNGAVASRPRKSGLQRRGRWQCERFNGAVASRPPKKSVVRLGGPQRNAASTGPWLFSHGTAATNYINWPQVRRLQRGRGLADTDDSARKASMIARRLLQRGRGLQATEGLRGGESRAVEWRTSTGPWLRSHGRSRARRRECVGAAGFNGAVAARPRKAGSCKCQ